MKDKNDKADLQIIKQMLQDKSFKDNYSDSEVKEISIWVESVLNTADKDEVAEQKTEQIKVCSSCGTKESESWAELDFKGSNEFICNDCYEHLKSKCDYEVEE